MYICSIILANVFWFKDVHSGRSVQAYASPCSDSVGKYSANVVASEMDGVYFNALNSFDPHYMFLRRSWFHSALSSKRCDKMCKCLRVILAHDENSRLLLATIRFWVKIVYNQILMYTCICEAIFKRVSYDIIIYFAFKWLRFIALAQATPGMCLIFGFIAKYYTRRVCVCVTCHLEWR